MVVGCSGGGPRHAADPEHSVGPVVPRLAREAVVAAVASPGHDSGGRALVVHAEVAGALGAANPGGFDYRRWLLASGYSAGYIKTGKRMLKPAAKPFKARWQGNLRSLLEQHGLVHSTTLLALVTGNGSGVDAQTWERYRRTGAIHLLVVSGLHVSALGAVFTLGYPLRLISAGKAGAYVQLASALVVCIAAVWFAWFTGAFQ